MNILAIHYGFNSSIAYLENGKLLYLLHEEKFDNIKNSICFPIECINFLREKIDFSKIDKISIGPKNISKKAWNRYLDKSSYNIKQEKYFFINLKDRLFYFIYKLTPFLFNFYNDYRTDNKKHIEKAKKWFANELTKHLRVDIKKDMIDLVEHHITHALSPVYFYGLYKQKEPVLLLSLDGAGDRYCSSVRVWENGKIKDLGVTRFQYSLGFLWTYITSLLGMKPHEHEYKVMGLAAYTSEKYFISIYEKFFKDLIYIDGFNFKSKIPLNRANVYFYKKLIGYRFDNIAGALQYLTEKIVSEWVLNAVKKTGIKKIAVSGGVFMNIKLNKKIQELEDLEKIYFMPSAGDESTVLGLIFHSYLLNGGDLNKLDEIKTMYCGIDIGKDDTSSFIENNIKGKYNIEYLENEEKSSIKVSELLSKFEIVGVCRGKGEWGARSLCNRAILSNASDLKSFHTVNDMIKMRDFWMPFAPTMLEEFAPIYLKNWEQQKNKVIDSCYYMITAFDSTDRGQKDLIAAMHQKDKTLRPQLVNPNTNNWMYNMLKNYEKLTGMGGVMNTSLNIHGYPLVGTLDQALFTFENSGLKYILIDNYLISK
ncbi:hypothetical protein EOM39_02630 [Candidatus Gracilibacteria bacterium]|nr:hypothetical protein [Candidatus Gracilibacteria bacterium]